VAWSGVLAGVVAAAALAAGVRWQHVLYRQAEYRAAPLSGRRLTVQVAAVAGVGGAAVGLAWRPGFGGVSGSVLSSLAVAVLCLASSTDLHRRLIPDRLMYPAIVGAAAATPFWPDRSPAELWAGAGVALAIAAVLFLGGAVFGALIRSAETPFGLGDVKLIVFIGLVTGWPAVLSALLLGVVVAGVPALILLAARRSRSVFSYGPYLALGALLVLLFPGAFRG